MRVGVIGAGYWGSKQVRVFSSNPAVSRVVIIDPRVDVRQQLGEHYPDALQRGSFTEAADEVDAVVVSTPPATHFEIASAAIEAGKHVLVEKPMTTNSREAADLVAMAEDAGVTLAVGHTFLYDGAVRKLAEIVHGGELGRLRRVDASRQNLGLYRSDVNVLWDLAAHDISILMLLTGTTPDTVSAWGARHTPRFAEDVATLRMTFDALGVEAMVHTSWLHPTKVRRTTVIGTEKMAVYDDTAVDATVQIVERRIELQNDLATAAPEVTYHMGGTATPPIDVVEPLQLAATEFLDCCATGATPRADGRAGLSVVSVLEASTLSLAEHGAPVPVATPETAVPTGSLG